jgi:hypothetical protein
VTLGLTTWRAGSREALGWACASRSCYHRLCPAVLPVHGRRLATLCCPFVCVPMWQVVLNIGYVNQDKEEVMSLVVAVIANLSAVTRFGVGRHRVLGPPLPPSPLDLPAAPNNWSWHRNAHPPPPPCNIRLPPPP